VPKSLHAALLDEAEAEGISLNQLIVSKLSIRLDARLAG
jgi:predicted HicB family RNase H-like nuclease